ncbi:MAG TPA: hypothetical protein PLV58_06895 [Campylobacterales bacterium]|nr:hypothetical protein [Campylobacterales bacterium]
MVISEAEADLEKLPDDVLLEVFDYFAKYETDPYKYSAKLYSQGVLNLEGYRKTYVASAAYRIVLKVEDGVAKIVEVVAVGERKDKAAYEEAYARIYK